MIKHLSTHYVDREGYLIAVSVNLYDDGLQITSTQPNTVLNLYWHLNKMELITPLQGKKPAQFGYPEPPQGQLMISDKSFLNAIMEKMPNVKLPAAQNPLPWRMIGLGLFVAALLAAFAIAINVNTRTSVMGTLHSQPSVAPPSVH